MRHDFVVRNRRRRLTKVTYYEQYHVIALRNRRMEIDAELLRRPDKLDVALLLEFAREGVEHGLARLDATARKMPAVNIRVLDQEHAALPVDHEAAHAERQSARQAPIQGHDRARSVSRQESQTAQNALNHAHVR